MNRRLLLALPLLGALFLSSRDEDPAMTLDPILEWLPSETAPSTRPAWVVKGDFILPDGNRIYIPDQRAANAGWGRIGSSHIVDPEQKPLPVALEITWFSVTEQQSYTARVDLPTDRLIAQFTTPRVNPIDGTSATPDRLIVGLAPGGDVAVWSAGMTGTTEVGLWQAEPIDLSMETLIGEGDLTEPEFAAMLVKENLDDEARKALAASGPQPGWWRTRAQRFVWAPEVVAATGRGFQLETLNGEVEWLAATPIPGPAPRAAPEQIYLYWQGSRGPLVATLAFDPVESLTAMQKFTEDQPERPLRLMLEPASSGGSVEVAVTDGILIYRFQHVKVSVYSG